MTNGADMLTVHVGYCGFSVLDYQFAPSALRWIVAELTELLPFGCERIALSFKEEYGDRPARLVGRIASDCENDGTVIFEHHINHILKIFRFPNDVTRFAYVVRTDPDFPFTCYAFVADDIEQAMLLLRTLRLASDRIDNSRASTSPTTFSTPSTLVTPPLPSATWPFSSSTPSIDQFSQYEVLYVCRIEIIGSTMTPSVVDEAARRYENEYKMAQARYYVRSSMVHIADESSDMVPRYMQRFGSDEDDLDQSAGSSLLLEALVDSVFLDDSPMLERRTPDFVRSKSNGLTDVVKRRAGSNRSMLLLVGRCDISLISLGRKDRLLTKRLTEISCVVQGSKYPDHFCFVCPDALHEGHSECFVIRCQDNDIARTAVRSMKSAFIAAFGDQASAGCRQHMCDKCPLYQYCCLCSDVDGLQPKQVRDVLVNRINRLAQQHQELVWKDYKKSCQEFIPAAVTETNGDSGDFIFDENCDEPGDDVAKKNLILMSILRSICESAQVSHSRNVGKAMRKETSSTSEIRLVDECTAATRTTATTTTTDEQQQRLAATTSVDRPGQRFVSANKLFELRDRAKKSLAVSLDSLIKKTRNSRETDSTTTSGDVIKSTSFLKSKLVGFNRESQFSELHLSSSSLPSPNRESNMAQPSFYFDTPERLGEEKTFCRPRSSTVGDVSTTLTAKAKKSLKPIMPNGDNSMAISFDHGNIPTNASLRNRRMSWRQAIFTRVVSPRLFVSRHSVASLENGFEQRRMSTRASSGTSISSSPSTCCEDKPRDNFYRALWKKAIMEQILTLRIDNQKKLQGEEALTMRKLKLTYEEITPCSEEEVRSIWTAMLNHPDRDSVRIDRVRLEEAVKAGVPRDLRADVWKFLLAQHLLDRVKRSQMEPPPPHNYRELLKDLTSYQHAILIDLGRTFPSHGYFSQPLGPGQLSLFNILKAYSLFDTEVGYCQGLSFIAGVLLLHMEEDDAFEMLANMMYKLQLRRQYRPDMLALQIEMYQLSRLLHDRHRDLFQHLEQHEIPILYAAPWFLTLFASAFPLGFVARVFDFVFLAGGLEVVFKIALVLLSDHKELIKHCDSFESINEFLKTTLPSMSIIQMERIFNQVFELDISRDLLAYEVEYHVLQEEILASPGLPTESIPLPQASIPHMNQMAKLESVNNNLKRQNLELLEQLQQAHNKIAIMEKTRLELEMKLDSAHETIISYKCKANSYESRLQALELERKLLLTTIQQHRDSSTNSCSLNGVSSGFALASPSSTDDIISQSGKL